MEEAFELRRSLGLLGRQLELPGFDASTVGPFQTGLFLVPHGDGLQGRLGQWGLIRPGQPGRIDYIQPKADPGKKPRAKKPRHTNNARIEAMDGTERPTNAAKVWKAGRRCLIPARWYQEPNWELKTKNIWWHLTRADGQPWFLAGLWSDDWADPETGEVIPSFTMVTRNCDGHPLLGRLHRHNDKLPDDAQDKRSLVHIDPENWEEWFHGSEAVARDLIKLQPTEVFDLADARATDAALAALGEA